MPRKPPSPPPTREEVLAAAHRLPGRMGTTGHTQSRLPGPCVVDIARALNTDATMVSPHLGDLVRDGALRVQTVGPYRCYLPTTLPLGVAS